MELNTLKNRLQAKIKGYKVELDKHDQFAANFAKNNFPTDILDKARKDIENYLKKLQDFVNVEPVEPEDDEQDEAEDQDQE